MIFLLPYIWFMFYMGIVFLGTVYISTRIFEKSIWIYVVAFLSSLLINLYIYHSVWYLPLLLIGGHGSGIDHTPELVHILRPFLVHLIFASILLLFKRHDKTIKGIFFLLLVIVIGLQSKISFDSYVETHTPHPEHRLDKKSNFLNKELYSLTKNMLNKASLPWWKKPVLNKDKYLQDSFLNLREVVMQQPNVEYIYRIFMSGNYAIVEVTSPDRKKFHLIVRISKDNVWKIDEILQTKPYQFKEIIFGDTRATWVRDEKYSKKIVDFYNNEFNSSIQSFIDASSPIEVFRARLKYGFALRCMESFDNIYKYLNYREKTMQELAKNEKNGSDSLEVNQMILNKLASKNDFILLGNMQHKIMTYNDMDVCKTLTPVHILYKQFIDEYSEILADLHYVGDSKIATMLKKNESSYANKDRKNRLTERLYQKLSESKWKKIVSEKIHHMIDNHEMLDTKVSFSTNQFSKKTYPLVMSMEACDYNLTKYLLEHNVSIIRNEYEDVMLDASLMCNTNMVQLFIEHGIQIDSNSTKKCFEKNKYYTYIIESDCQHSTSDIRMLLNEQIVKGLTLTDYESMLTNREKRCNKDWNTHGGYMALPPGYVYTGKYVSHSELLKITDRPELIQFIKNEKNIHIRDIEYNETKRESYEVKTKTKKIYTAPITYDGEVDIRSIRY